MIRWAREQDPDGYPHYSCMEEEIGESWFSDDCPLCRRFLHEANATCRNCPLRIIFGCCSDPSALNAWSEIRQSLTWSEWLEAAEVMLAQLKAVLKLLKGDEGV